MIIASNICETMINSPSRRFGAKVELFNGSTLAATYYGTDNIVDFSIERTGENKFFGFGICQKLSLNLLDNTRAIELNEDNSFNASIGVNEEYVNAFPRFHLVEVKRDENSNKLTVTAYDALYNASSYTVGELGMEAPYTLAEYAAACANFLGVPVEIIQDGSFDVLYEEGANLDGSETIREVLNAIAEATQSIYFINWENKLVFRRLSIDGAPVVTIDKNKYFELTNKESRVIGAIAHATELGNNIIATIGEGETQYIRENPFWELQDNIAELIEEAAARVNGLTITQFDCNWRGNFLVELGDKIALQTKTNGNVYSYLLNDTITFNGGLSQKSQWEYNSEENESANPTTLGEAIKKTYARVDKVNKQIELVASEISATSAAMSSLQINLDGINASVTKAEATVNEMSNEVNNLASKVDATITAEEVNIQIQQELLNGATKVITSTGYKLDDEGLTVSKSNSEIETTISDNGMQVKKEGVEMLVANQEGVKAADLHATTFLIVGGRSRFENYGTGKTACFWIGG